MSEFTGLVEMTPAQREQLVAQCIDFDFGNLVCSADEIESANIQELMIQNKIREDQFRMNSCAGFGVAHAAATAFYFATGYWREFNPHWSYRRGQEIDGIRGDNGATIHGVVTAAMRSGLLPDDIENDGKKEFPYPRDNYGFQYPASATTLAAERKIGYMANLTSWEAMFNFIVARQGAIVIGGPWGNWRPGPGGVCNSFVDGGGGHARCRNDIVKLDSGEWALLEPNSHFENYGDRGFGKMTRRFVEQELRSRNFVAIGVSDIKLAPGDKPTPRKRRFVNFTGKA